MKKSTSKLLKTDFFAYSSGLEPPSPPPTLLSRIGSRPKLAGTKSAADETACLSRGIFRLFLSQVKPLILLVFSLSITPSIFFSLLPFLADKNLSLYSLYYAEACNELAGPISASLHPGNTVSFEELLQRWRAVSNSVSDLTGPKFESQISRSIDARVTARPTSRLNHFLSNGQRNVSIAALYKIFIV